MFSGYRLHKIKCNLPKTHISCYNYVTNTFLCSSCGAGYFSFWGGIMQYKKFSIKNYRAIKEPIVIDLSKRIIPLVGINECGKTTILQALFCFDFMNDKANEGKHLKNTHNLYDTTPALTSEIIATISCKKLDIALACEKAIRALASQDKAVPNSKIDYTKGIDSVQQYAENLPNVTEIEIKRTLGSNYYKCDTLKGVSPIGQHYVCQQIISGLPYILYNDDFTDRPESVINISDNDDDRSEWEAIYDKVFRQANPEYSLQFVLECEDERTRKTILAKVTRFLSKSLTASWAKFSPTAQKISVDLSVNVAERKLEVFIVEETKGEQSHFFITDRSKGFIWYYNFIMKIMFNPKETGDTRGTVFLLDEPGSYLHESAQTELCTKLADISKNEGVVIYCTHSPRLLNPDYIPLNNILIVEKEKNTRITAIPLPEKKTNAKNRSAMQPVYEALYIPEYEMISRDEKVICVEGIYDKYAIECFCKLPDNARMYPSTNADAIVNNISSFIAYQKIYIALWDSDKEGDKCIGQARKVFGPYEAQRFFQLPKMGREKRRMEEMIELEDYPILKSMLDLSDDATYETIISTLYFLSDKRRQKKVIDSVSDITKSNFAALERVIGNSLSFSGDDKVMVGTHPE